jgi:serine protease Do
MQQVVKGAGMSIPQENYREVPVTRYGKLSTSKRALAALGCAGAIGLAVLGTTATTVWHSRPALAQDLTRAPNSFADVAEKVRPAVVSIFTKGSAGTPEGQDFNMPDLPPEHPFFDFFDQFRRNFPNGRQQPRQRLERAQGSGFVISADGYVVTNHHVVNNASEISVTFDNDEKYTATVVGSDQRTDLALLKIKRDQPFTNFVEFSNEKPRVGDWVLAVGNPFGLGGTVTAGIVSAGGRSIGAGPYDFLQIDAAVNRGNSGGPAVNLKGQVIGVNTAIYSPSGGNVGIAFAIPSELARKVIDELKSSGKVSRGWLGVTIQDVGEDIAESLGLKEPKGALISRIMEDGPSANSELKVRDVIIRVNGEQVNNSRDLARKIAELQPNSDTKLVVIRDGAEQNLNIKLGTFPSSDKLAAYSEEDQGGDDRRSEREQMRDLGLTLAPAKEIQGAGEKGVALTEVDPASEAAEKGLRSGDVILEVGGEPVNTASDVANGIREARRKGRKAVLLQVTSNRQTRYVALSVENNEGAAKN